MRCYLWTECTVYELFVPCKAKILRWLFQTILISASMVWSGPWSRSTLRALNFASCQWQAPVGNAKRDKLSYKVNVLLLLVLPWKAFDTGWWWQVVWLHMCLTLFCFISSCSCTLCCCIALRPLHRRCSRTDTLISICTVHAQHLCGAHWCCCARPCPRALVPCMRSALYS